MSHVWEPELRQIQVGTKFKMREGQTSLVIIRSYNLPELDHDYVCREMYSRLKKRKKNTWVSVNADCTEGFA